MVSVKFKPETDALELASIIVPLWEKAGKPDIKIPSRDRDGNETNLREYLAKVYKGKQLKIMLQIVDLCEEKVNFLIEKGYENTYLKKLGTIYRQAIGTKAKLEMSKGYQEYLPFYFFKVPLEIIAKVNNDYRDTVDKKREIQEAIDQQMIDDLLTVTRKLIKSKDVYEQAIALTLLTGRRPFSEVLRSCEYHKIDSFNARVTGLAEKTINQSIDSIPLLTDFENVANAKKSIKEYLQKSSKYSEDMDNNKFAANYSDNMQQPINKYIIPIFERAKKLGGIYQAITPHTLRSLYALICYVEVNKRVGAYTIYCSRILGHLQERRDGKLVSNTKTSESYDRFNYVENLEIGITNQLAEMRKKGLID